MNKFAVPLWLSVAQKTLAIPLALGIANRLSGAAASAMGGDARAVIADALVALALMAAVALLDIVGDTLVKRRAARALNQYRLGFLSRLLDNPLHVLSSARHGELTENINDDIAAATDRWLKLYPTMIAGALTAAGYAVWLALRSPVVAVTLIAIASLQFVPPLIIRKYMQFNYERCREIEADISEHVVQAVDGFESIKLFGLNDWWLQKMAAFHREYLVIGKRTDATAAAHISMYKLLDNILRYGTYALMGIYAMQGYCAMPVAMEAVVLASGLYAAVKQVFSGMPEIAVSKAADARLAKWLHAEVGEGKVPGDARVALRNLSFSHGDAPILSGIDAQFGADARMLFAGANGAGKSTLLNLIAGISLPTGGAVEVGGVKPQDFADAVYPRELLYIPQDDPEFDFPASELFAMFGEENGGAIQAAAERLGLPSDRTADVPMRELSGGERKKALLSIGFALDPVVLMLDEPSNSLDAHGQTALFELIAGRKKATYIVSHDPRYGDAVDEMRTIRDGGVHHG